MKDNGVVGATLYFNPQDKKHRDAYRVLSIFPRKKTELVTCLVQKFLAENGISDIEQVSDKYLQKIIKRELQKNDYSVLLGVISALSNNQPIDKKSRKNSVSKSKSIKTSQKKQQISEDQSPIIKNDMKAFPNNNHSEKVIPEKEYFEDNDTEPENDDTTGLTDDWQDKLGFFKL